MTDPIPYFDPFVPADPEDGPPPAGSMKVSYFDTTAGKATPIMRYSAWPAWSMIHYIADGTVKVEW
jgi:hypothetical protein